MLMLGFVACGTVEEQPAPPSAEQPETVTPARIPSICGASQEGGVCAQRCGMDDPTPAQVEAMRQALSTVSAQRYGNGQGLTTIDVWFHVIRSGTTHAQGDVPESVLDAQIRVLNEGYGDLTSGFKSRFNFVKRGVTRTTNATWYSVNAPSGGVPSATEVAMKQALHQGDARTLNIYTVLPASGTLGWARFPTQLGETNGLALDGIVVNFTTLPGGSYTQYNRGFTAVHEAGHWLGLFHPFQGGCSAVNDDIIDTPAMAAPRFGCPNADTFENTCTLLPGNDPLHNYMGYVDDPCMWEFTSGQVTRMANLYTNLRQGVLSSVDGYLTHAQWNYPITSTIDGGAVDYDTPNSSILVRAYWDGHPATGAPYTEVSANLPNGFINEIYGIAGDHGFSITVPAHLRNGVEHTAYIYGFDSSSGQMSILTNGTVKFTINP